ncbi:unnamed protein product [Calicophoron daubneyi]|uniref:Uncharacterized protein n=1 Tax=Calicophoron daubneyi TaxID=300641 RepID=A0AAV2T917_CALDB
MALGRLRVGEPSIHPQIALYAQRRHSILIAHVLREHRPQTHSCKALCSKSGREELGRPKQNNHSGRVGSPSC